MSERMVCEVREHLLTTNQSNSYTQYIIKLLVGLAVVILI